MSQTFEFKIQIEGPDISREGKIPMGVWTIGRVPGNNLTLSHEQVSRRHAQLHCTETDILITDLGSHNGTFVNGDKLSPNVTIALSDGDTIKIGPYTLTIRQINSSLPKEPVVEEEISIYERNEQTRLNDLVLPGLSIFSRRLLNYLPDPYHPPVLDENKELRYPSSLSFMARFLGIFETILTPIEWNVDNFDLYLDPGTAPIDFLPWLANWFRIIEASWDEQQRRTFLAIAHEIYERRGTKWALEQVLKIHTGITPRIVEPDDQPHLFSVVVRVPAAQTNDPTRLEHLKTAAARIIEASKPAHTTYTLEVWTEREGASQS